MGCATATIKYSVFFFNTLCAVSFGHKIRKIWSKFNGITHVTFYDSQNIIVIVIMTVV